MWRGAARRVCLAHLEDARHPLRQVSSRRGAVTVSVTPAAGLADQPASTVVSGLAPLQEVTLRALATNEQGSLFDSCAHYQADGHGRVDLSTDCSLGGDYAGLEPMGLFWSLSPANMEKPYQKLWPSKVKTPLKVELSVHQGYSQPGALPGQVLARANVERRFTLPEGRRIRLKEGVVRGSLFLPPGEWKSLCIPIPTLQIRLLRAAYVSPHFTL